jgi:hypothetical protein
MPRRPFAHVGAELSERVTAIEIARAQLFDVDVDRKKRIDDAIDYFGAGHIDVARKGVRRIRLAAALPWLIRTSRTFRTTPHGRVTRFRRACRVRPRAER